ncbi:NAD(P)-dependent oxidoreductase [Paraburkholderia fynbosensis]|uniref:2-hydroxyacid dehydrogenase n=1 Tax=Paraburkholderia fynbosensis TaxID=1200993 RepID=A0A6J5GY15_9BURK|nr:NAD(P)-dependent oxidoreductase [Paraburkholderia fynbosensis]CAB3806965.1 Putative 2-hydroxyacid dehydrogenase [Paraburkholderia fynbosensis]
MNTKPLNVVFLDAGTLPYPLDFGNDQAIDYQAFDSTASDEVAARIANADVVITNKIRLQRPELDAAPKLSLIVIAAAGTDNVDIESARARGVEVKNVPDYGTHSVAEHVMATLFALRRDLLTYSAAASDGRWTGSSHFSWTGPKIYDLAGSQLGIVGRGRIGQAVGNLAQSLGMKVLFAEDPASSGNVGDEAPLQEVLSTSDAISLHVPLTADTRHLINAETLGLMKPHAVLINTARGALVDSAALVDGLQRGIIGGAAIDVLDVEPPPLEHPLLRADVPRLLVTPHVAWASASAQARLASRVCDFVLEHLRRVSA